VKETFLAGVAGERGRQERHVPPTVHVLAVVVRARWLDEHNVCAMRRTVCGISPFSSTRIEI
jgi:hypothetical protein